MTNTNALRKSEAGKGIAVAKRKLFNNNYLNAQGGLEPDFRVLVSTLFHPVAQGNGRWGGKQWNLAEAKVLQTVANLRTYFFCVSV